MKPSLDQNALCRPSISGTACSSLCRRKTHPTERKWEVEVGGETDERARARARGFHPCTSMSGSSSQLDSHVLKTFVQNVSRAFYDAPAIILFDQLLKREV